MKCENCGATLQPVEGTEMKYCSYCGAKVEMKAEVPDTIAGAVHGIGQTILKQKAARESYEREHHAEIRAEKEADEKQRKKSQNKALLMLALLMLVGILIGILGKNGIV